MKFKLQYKCGQGHSIHIVGGIECLGRWDHRKSVPLAWNVGDVWVGNMSLPVGQRIEYKYLVKNANGRVSRWQDGGNIAVQIAEEHSGQSVTACEVSDSWCKTWHMLLYGPFPSVLGDPDLEAYYAQQALSGGAGDQQQLRPALPEFASTWLENTYIRPVLSGAMPHLAGNNITPHNFRLGFGSQQGRSGKGFEASPQNETASDAAGANKVTGEKGHAKQSAYRPNRGHVSGELFTPTASGHAGSRKEAPRERFTGKHTNLRQGASFQDTRPSEPSPSSSHSRAPSEDPTSASSHAKASSDDRGKPADIPADGQRAGKYAASTEDDDRAREGSWDPRWADLFGNDAPPNGSVVEKAKAELQVALHYSRVLEQKVLDPTSPEWLDLDRRMALAAGRLYSKRDSLLQVFMEKEEMRQLAVGTTVETLGRYYSIQT